MQRYAGWTLILIAISIGLWPGLLGSKWLVLGGDEPGPTAAMLAVLGVGGLTLWAQTALGADL
jgi:hypothetical protein